MRRWWNRWQDRKQGATRLPGMLLADTLNDLRAMLPAGLTRRDRTAVMSRMVTETWD